MTSLIDYHKVQKIYNSGNDEVIALEEISFAVGEGEFITVVGRSGCGKTTLLKLTAGLLAPTAGTVHVAQTAVIGLLTTTLMDYLLPTSTDVPPIDSVILEEAPSPLNPLGVKGAGEGGIVGTGAALANAVTMALAPLGVEVRDLPLSPNRIKEWIRHKPDHEGS